MDTANSSTTEELPANGPGPGGKLQAARIQLGLSIGDVADRMHLSNAILEALEDNNFDEITAPIFVKGYLRAYARIVAIDEESVISEYAELYSDEDPPITTTSNTAAEISSSDTRVKWMTYLVVIVLIALIATWWWSEQRSGEQLISLDAERSESPTPASASTDLLQQQPLMDSSAAAAADPDSSADDTMADEDSNEEDLPLMSLQPPEPTDEAAAEAGEAAPVSVETGSSDSSPVIPVASPEQPVAADAPVNVAERKAPAGNDQFRLVVNADTWADIKDANGVQLIYDLMRADNTLVMTGTAPFEVFLGNGHGVDVEINGTAVDITSYIRDDNTARFQTGG